MNDRTESRAPGPASGNRHSPIPNPLADANRQSVIANPFLPVDVRQQIDALLPNYPTSQAATLPALHAINERLGYVPIEAVVELAAILGLAPSQVQDTLSFYGFFKQDKPMGRYKVSICRSIVCAAWDSEELVTYLSAKLGIKPGETTPDGKVSLEIAECLGTCDAAPVLMVNDTVYGGITKDKIDALVEEWKREG